MGWLWVISCDPWPDQAPNLCLSIFEKSTKSWPEPVLGPWHEVLAWCLLVKGGESAVSEVMSYDIPQIILRNSLCPIDLLVCIDRCISQIYGRTLDYQSICHPVFLDKCKEFPGQNHDLSWFIMIYHDLSWFIMIYHDLSWFIMIYHDLSWFIMIYHDLSMFSYQ